MIKLDKKERKKIFFGILAPYFKKKGFKKYLTGMDPTFVLHDEKVTVHLFFNFNSNDTIIGGSYHLTFYEIEDYILEIGIPTNKLVEQKKKGKYHISTISQRTLPANIDRRELKTSIEVEEYANLYIDYYENEGAEFLKKFDSIPSIQKEIMRLESNGGDIKQLIDGMGDAFMRYLLISKLCNDSGYEAKYLRIDSMAKQSKEFLPYWNKYSELLKRIKPKYFID
jgi:hypothetical protein